MSETIRIGTRKSKLALWQANYVKGLLSTAYPTATVELITFVTKGDKVLDKSLPAIGGKGLFTAELERSLLKGEIDCAVHSLKDLPTDNPDGLVVGAIPERAPVEDVLISRSGAKLDDLPEGAVIGTSSLRRAAQLRHHRPDLKIIDIRGNVPTRIKKALDPDGPYDATVLARAGVERLGLHDQITEVLSLELMLPAPGQGAIGIQCRDSADALALFAPIDHAPTRHAVTAERAFLNQLEGGCSVPVAAYATVQADDLHLSGRVIAVDASRMIAQENRGRATEADPLGRTLADQAAEQGAREILAEVKA